MMKTYNTKIYMDRENFTHKVTYWRRKNVYVKRIYNPKGEYCSSAEYTKEQIKTKLSGMKLIATIK